MFLKGIVVIVIFQLENEDVRRQLAPPDRSRNAVDERGDRRRTPLQLEESPTRVQDVERKERTNKKKKSATPTAPRMLENVPADSECVYDHESLSTSTPGETTQVSATTKSQPPRDNITQVRPTFTPDEMTPVSATTSSRPTRDDISQEETIGELTPTASHTEPSAELQNIDKDDEQQLETIGEDLQQSYVMIEKICTTEDADLNKNSPRENKIRTTEATTCQVAQVTELVNKTSMI